MAKSKSTLDETYQPGGGPLRGKYLEAEKLRLKKRKAAHLKKMAKSKTARTKQVESQIGSGLTKEELDRFR
jgi:hypothetical protein